MSISTDFLQLLVHPVYKTPLQFDPATMQLIDVQHNERFPIKEEVPVLLTENLDPELLQTERNKEAHSQFQYKEHYQRDAVSFNYSAESVHPVEKAEIGRLRQYILAAMPRHASWTLDVGCGGAWLAKKIAPEGRNIISMDISDINPINAKKAVPAANHAGLVADVYELPFKENTLDCIVAAEIIEHVSDPARFLAALYTVLKPGGRLIVTTPYDELIRTSLCIHCNRETPHNAHLHSFTERTMRHYVPRDARKVQMKVFSSKLLIKTRVQRMLSFLPLSVWKPIDTLGNAITGKKASRLMVIIEK